MYQNVYVLQCARLNNQKGLSKYTDVVSATVSTMIFMQNIT
jgi:hypothetical protein